MSGYARSEVEIIFVGHVWSDYFSALLIKISASIILSIDPIGLAVLEWLIWQMRVTASPGPPGPTDVVLLAQLGNIFDVLVTSIRIALAVDHIPLVHEDWDLVFLLERYDPVLEVVIVP